MWRRPSLLAYTNTNKTLLGSMSGQETSKVAGGSWHWIKFDNPTGGLGFFVIKSSIQSWIIGRLREDSKLQRVKLFQKLLVGTDVEVKVVMAIHRVAPVPLWSVDLFAKSGHLTMKQKDYIIWVISPIIGYLHNHPIDAFSLSLPDKPRSAEDLKLRACCTVSRKAREALN